MLQELHERIFYFRGSVLGFDAFDAFRFTAAEENPSFGYLESVEDPSVGFVVASPFALFADYQFEIDDKDKAELGLTSPEEVLVLSIIHVKNPFTDSTVNLLAPLIVNLKSDQGRQIILTANAYSAKEKFVKSTRYESGDDAC